MIERFLPFFGLALLEALALPAAFAEPPASASPLPALSAADADYERALRAYRQGKLDEAARILEDGLGRGPERVSHLTLLGWARLRTDRVEDAERRFSRAVEMDPSSSEAHAGLGYVGLRRGRPADAEKAFRRALQLRPESSDALKGLGIALRDLGRKKEARDALERAGKANPEDREIPGMIAGMGGAPPAKPTRREPVDPSSPLRVATRAAKDYFEVRVGGEWRPIFVKGVNLSTAIPGRFPSEFPDDAALYRRWFEQMAELGANTVRLYTLHPPSLYRALREHNRRHPERKLWLVQGVWTELPDDDDYDHPKFRDAFLGEIRTVIDAVHGKAEVEPRPGHASGSYDADLAEDLLAWLVGREWEPYSIRNYERLHPERTTHRGKYVSAEGVAPFEAWLASICDATAAHETEKHRWQHPVAFSSWPTIDPLRHTTEASKEEETKFRRARGLPPPTHLDYDDDAVQVDVNRFRREPALEAGLYASYHVYPYHPEFMILEPAYAEVQDGEGPSRYLGYLQDLKAHHRDLPLLIAEFGVPSSTGLVHLHPEGQNHGGHSTIAQGRINARLLDDIHRSRTAGGIVFAWVDEWFKRSWLVKSYESPEVRNPRWLNVLEPEQNFGLLAAWPGTRDWKIRIDGDPGDWSGVPPLVSNAKAPEERPASLRSMRVAADEAYLYLRVDLHPRAGAIDWSRERIWIGVDTYDRVRGDHLFPPPAEVETPIGLEFLVRVEGPETASILVDSPYDIYANTGWNRPYRSLENRDGVFEEMVVTMHRERWGRDGTRFPAKVHSRSGLVRGSMDPASPDYDTRAHWIEGEGERFVELRLPWFSLNVLDPSSRRVIHEDVPSGDHAGTIETDGFRFHVLLLASADGAWRVADELPRRSGRTMPASPTFTWKPWEAPSYRLEVKDGTRLFADALRAIPDPLPSGEQRP